MITWKHQRVLGSMIGGTLGALSGLCVGLCCSGDDGKMFNILDTISCTAAGFVAGGVVGALHPIIIPVSLWFYVDKEHGNT